MRNPKEALEEKFLKELCIKLNEDCPTHIPVETMIEIVFEASKKAGKDCYLVLKHFQFTEEEIRDYFERTGKKSNSNMNREN